mmetsp:Transcript_11061/g.18501  ORF Transcript_11061/g.18501 Transcript_11061/m.18501 type:complete len:135 (+) Transcript_11061:674-1078(+)
MYRLRGEDDVAKIFVANGQVFRQNGDQVGIEICTGKALMEGNLKMKIYNDQYVYVLNHETDSIYNDIVKFKADNMEEALKQFNSYPKEDSTVILRGSDGSILKKKGTENLIGQNLAYLYNDSDNAGKLMNSAYS